VTKLRPGVGDRIYATAGDENKPFREEVIIPPYASGTPFRPTTIAAWPGQPPPVLDGAYADAPGKPAMAVGIHVGAPYVHLRGLTVRHYSESGIDMHNSTGNVVADCTAERCGRHGIFAYYSPDSSIVNPTVSECDAQGISLRSSPGTVVLGGSSNNNGIDGLLVLQESDRVVVDGLTAQGNARGIAFVFGSDQGRVFRSNVSGNRQDGVFIAEDAEALVIDTIQ